MHWVPVFSDQRRVRYWRFGSKIRKSDKDTTEYQLIRLLDGVQVLVCSDQLAASSGASVLFRVGSFDQPVFVSPYPPTVNMLIIVDLVGRLWACSFSRTLRSPVRDE